MINRRRLLGLALLAFPAAGIGAACGGIEQSEFDGVKKQLAEEQEKGKAFQGQMATLQQQAIKAAATLATAVGPMTQTFQIALGEVKIAEEVDGKDVLTGESHRWEPDVLVVNKGDKVVLEVLNPRSRIHSLVLKEFGVDTKDLQPRTGKATVEFVADKAGVFQFTCGIDPAKEPYKERTDACEIDHKFQVGYLLVLQR